MSFQVLLLLLLFESKNLIIDIKGMEEPEIQIRTKFVWMNICRNKKMRSFRKIYAHIKSTFSNNSKVDVHQLRT